MLMKPTQHTLDNPAVDAKPTAVLSVSTSQNGANASLSQLVPVRLGVVGPVTLDFLRPVTRPTSFARHRWNGIHQWNQLGHVLPIGCRDRGRERNPVRVGDDVVLGAFLAAIRGVGAGFRPPKTARTEALSTTARDRQTRET